MQVEELLEKITANMPNFKIRHSQLAMINHLNNCFDLSKNSANICLLEAPTGTGKSLAYLIAGITNSLKHNKKFIVSTATKALQNQLIVKDLPDLIVSSNLKIIYGIAKGRNNYLCPYQLDIARENANLELFENQNLLQENLYKIHNCFYKKSWDGDFDSLSFNVDNSLKKYITIEKEQCLNNLCEYNSRDNFICPYFKQKNFLKTCDVIITNHNLLLADILLGSKVVLPFEPQEYILCIDEGHNFAEIALQSMAFQFNLSESMINCTNLAKIFYDEDANNYLSELDIETNKKLYTVLLELLDSLQQLNEVLKLNVNSFNESKIILNDYLNKSAAIFKEYFVPIAYLAGLMHGELTKVIEQIKINCTNELSTQQTVLLNKLNYYLNSINIILKVTENILHVDQSRYAAFAKWIDSLVARDEIQFKINVASIHVGDQLKDLLWSKVSAVAIVSATLAVGDNFDYFINKLGFLCIKQVVTVKLAANFDYENVAQIVVPKFKYSAEYNNKENFNIELADYLTKILDYDESYGTLVLFFNKQQLTHTLSLLPIFLQKRILAQHNFFNKQQIIDTHKNHINKGKPSIIFGLNSFAAGVDLPRKYCMHVIITKIPFETYKDPIHLVQEYWFKFEKANYFTEIALPEASFNLIQACGRLIRSEEDYGQITICDTRLINKTYGKILLDTLPNFRRSYDKYFISDAFKKMATININVNE